MVRREDYGKTYVIPTEPVCDYNTLCRAFGEDGERAIFSDLGGWMTFEFGNQKSSVFAAFMEKGRGCVRNFHRFWTEEHWTRMTDVYGFHEEQVADYREQAAKADA